MCIRTAHIQMCHVGHQCWIRETVYHQSADISNLCDKIAMALMHELWDFHMRKWWIKWKGDIKRSGRKRNREWSQQQRISRQHKADKQGLTEEKKVNNGAIKKGKKHCWEKTFDKVMHCSWLQSCLQKSLRHSDCLKWLWIARLCFPPPSAEETKQTGASSIVPQRSVKYYTVTGTVAYDGMWLQLKKNDFQFTILGIHSPKSLLSYMTNIGLLM